MEKIGGWGKRLDECQTTQKPMLYSTVAVAVCCSHM